ncbi:TetR/AcrR family transcriptional regulator [Rhodococcus sp. HNM0569]|nr:TetR/AcrR family transcriptional regulator [Rhodococcus sp. HNM0569]
MWERPHGTRGPAPTFGLADIAAVAIDLAEEGGLPAVSTRRIAKALGMSQSALYRYVTSHDEVFDLMVDAAAGEIDLDVPLSGTVIDDLVALARRAKAVHVRRSWLLAIPVEALRVGPRGIDYLEFALRAMADADLPGPAKLQVIAVLNTLVQQFARTEIGDGTAGRHAAQAAYLGRVVGAGAHPCLAAAITPSDGVDARAGDLFETVVRRVLRGMLTTD